MNNEFQIYLIDDSPADARIILRALNESGFEHRLTVFESGERALERLSADVPRSSPDLILLDLNMPGMDGHQVLGAIKSDPDLKSIPVVILSTSRSDEDVRETYRRGANSFIQKPGEYEGYRQLAKNLRGYWGDTALRTPRRGGSS